MSFCCTTDLINRVLDDPDQKDVAFPTIRKRLCDLMAEDQYDRSSARFFLPSNRHTLTLNDTARIEEVLRLLSKIKSPSVSNIGITGSRAVWLVALHNWDFKGAGNIMLREMKRLYSKDRSDVFYYGIPYLEDRIMLGSKGFDHSAEQLYGTQAWHRRYGNGLTEDGLFPIRNPSGLSRRRKEFGLAAEPTALGRCEHTL
jgi:hypothetical protein